MCSAHRLRRKAPPVTSQCPPPVPQLPTPPAPPACCLRTPTFRSSGHSGRSCLFLSRLALGPATHWAQPAAPCQDKTEEASQAPCPLQGDPAPALCLRAAGREPAARGRNVCAPASRGAWPGGHGAVCREAGPWGGRRLAGFFLSPWGCGRTPSRVFSFRTYQEHNSILR